MPYIKDSRRHAIDYDVLPDVAGELNYKLTQLMKSYFACHNNYQGINDIIGALEACKLEFYRRVVVPYEDKKIQENGDVY